MGTGEAHDAPLCCRQSIFCDEVDFTRKSWEGISADAKDFVAALVNKDPSKRPTAKQVPFARSSHQWTILLLLVHWNWPVMQQDARPCQEVLWIPICFLCRKKYMLFEPMPG